jgi:4-hydroxy-tetrahydrodipicolinate synthase
MGDKYPTPPRGLICPVVTPLKADKTLDSRSFERLLRHVAGAVDGILLCDVAWGEGLELPENMRLDLVSCGLEMIMGRVPVFVTITGHTLKDTLRLMAEVEAFVRRLEYPGALFWVDYPLFYHGNRELPQMFRALLAETEIPVILGNRPDLVKKRKGPGRHHNIRTSVLKKIVSNAGIRGIIFTGDLKRAGNYLRAVRFRKDFVFYDGDETVFLKNPGLGGLIAGGSNLAPHEWLEITKSSLNRYDSERQFQKHQEAIWESGMMVQDLYSLYKAAPSFYMKRILKKAGIIENSQTISTFTGGIPGWEEKLENLFSTYDLV